MVGQLASETGHRDATRSFWVQYVDPVGTETRASLHDCSGLPLESALPVRTFSRFHGQRNNPGLWWSATQRRHIGFESWLERDHLTLLDFDPGIVAIAAQPFRLCWHEHDGSRSHVPDFFARCSDGTAVVLDVRPAARIGPKDAAVFATTRAACALTGWRYRLVHEPDPVLMANVRWLAGYRHPRCHRPDLECAAETVFANPTPLMAGAAALGDRLATLPAVFHLMWQRRLFADLSLPLSDETLLAVQR
jgi:hypothetical protein